jgi:hypothetical protein
MARQAGPIFITGTIDDLVFYKLGEHYYVRQKGERTPGVKKRLKQDKGYALLQLKQAEFGQASELVRQMYYSLPLEVRKQGLFGKLTGKAVRLLRAGKSKAEIKELLLQEMMPVQKPVATGNEKNSNPNTPKEATKTYYHPVKREWDMNLTQQRILRGTSLSDFTEMPFGKVTINRGACPLPESILLE